MQRFFSGADRILRGWVGGNDRPWRTVAILAGYIVCFSVVYGAVMGMFGLRGLQAVYSAVKVPLLLTATFLLALPSFFVLNTLAGLRNDFAEAVRALAITQAGVAITLAALSPFTILWYLSCDRYNVAILFNGLMFAVASGAGQILLRTHYKPLIARNPRHLLLLRSWLIVYAFVGIQMGWMLRPFIGNPGEPVQFFRDGTWGNAYVIVVGTIWDALTH